MDTSSCLSGQAWLSSSLLHCFCGIQTRSLLRAQTVLFYLQTFRCSLIAYVFVSNKDFTKILCTWFIYISFKQIHSHFYFLFPLSTPCSLLTIWTPSLSTSGLCGKTKQVGWECLLPLPPSLVSTLAFVCLPCISVRKHQTLTYYMYNHQRDSVVNYNEHWKKKMILLKCGVGEDPWESLGLQGDPTSPS